MDLRQLRYFLALADELHFGRAAELMNVVAPALSMQISALEKELGTKLLLRTSRKVSLTQAGQLFRVEAQGVLLQVEIARRAVQQASLGLAGRVRIGFVGSVFFAGTLSAHLQTFSKTHKAVEIELHEMTAQLQIEALMEGKLDVGYCPAFTARFHPSLQVRTVGEWSWTLAMANDHGLAKQAAVSVNDLREEHFILYASADSDSGQLSVLSEYLGYEPRICQRVSSTLAVFALASAGSGIALVPASDAHSGFEGVTVRPFENDAIRTRIVMLTNRWDTLPTVSAYVACVTREGGARGES